MVQKISAKIGLKEHKAEQKKNLILEIEFNLVYDCLERKRNELFCMYCINGMLISLLVSTCKKLKFL